MRRPIVAVLAIAGLLAVGADLFNTARRSVREQAERRQQAEIDAAYFRAFNACARRCEAEQPDSRNGQSQCIEQDCGEVSP